MIYKVQNPSVEKLMELMDLFKKEFNMLFCGNVLYMSLKSIKNTQKEKIESLKKNDFYIIELNAENLKFETTNVIEWCKNNFYLLEKEKFEFEQQDKLQDMLDFIDAFEQELQKLI
jgi:hypothetical protein